MSGNSGASREPPHVPVEQSPSWRRLFTCQRAARQVPLGAEVAPLRAVAPGRLTLAVFIIFQIADGLITYEAVTLFGPAAEGNPLLGAWVAIAGPGPALFSAKVLASACGVVLYVCQVHRVLAVLTALYLLAAVGPWLHVLSVLPSA